MVDEIVGRADASGVWPTSSDLLLHYCLGSHGWLEAPVAEAHSEFSQGCLQASAGIAARQLGWPSSVGLGQCLQNLFETQPEAGHFDIVFDTEGSHSDVSEKTPTRTSLWHLRQMHP